MEKKTVIIEVQTEDGVKQLDRLSAKFDEVYGDVLPLTASIGELEDQLYQMALEGKKGTEEFNLLAQEAGRLKKTLQQVDMEVDGLSMTTANKLGGALGGVTAGFELVQGAMGAMGAESEKVQEALLKVQSAMAMAQGVQGLKESAASFKALGASASAAFQGMSNGAKVFAVTGIGLLVAAIGYLVSNFDKLKNSFSTITSKQKLLNSTLSDYKQAATDATRQTIDVGNSFELAKKGVISKEEALKKYNDTLGSSLGTANNINEAEKLFRDKTDAYIKATALRAQANALLTKAAEQRVEQMLAEKEAEKLAQKSASDDPYSIINIAKKNGEAMAKQSKQQADELENLSANLLKEAAILEKSYNIKADKKEEIEIKSTESSADRKNKELEAEYAKNAEELEAYKRRLEEERGMQEAEDAWKLEQENKAIADQEAKDAKIRADEEELSAWKIKNWEREAAELERIENLKKERAERNKQFAIDNAEETFTFISDLATIFEGQSEESQRKAFKIRKAASIAQATVETYKAAQSAYASQIIVGDPTSPIRGAIAAAFAVASGLAKVKAISATQFGGGGSTSASGGGSGAPSLPQSNPAQFNIVGNSGTNQLNGLGGGVTQAYVVSGDVTTAQSLERNKITTATL